MINIIGERFALVVGHVAYGDARYFIDVDIVVFEMLAGAADFFGYGKVFFPSKIYGYLAHCAQVCFFVEACGCHIFVDQPSVLGFGCYSQFMKTDNGLECRKQDFGAAIRYAFLADMLVECLKIVFILIGAEFADVV